MRLPILQDCHEPWEDMPGSTRRRHCSACDRDVHDLSAMRAVEAKTLVMLFQSHGMCVRYATDAKGALLHVKEEPAAPARQLLSAARAKVVALTLASSVGCGPVLATTVKPPAGTASGAAPNAVPSPSPAECLDPDVVAQRPQTASDQDGDGIPNATDKCPYEPGALRDQGCPPPRGQLSRYVRVEMFSSVFYRHGERKLVPSALSLLKEMAARLKEHPEVTLVEVQGHAAANEPKPQQLSEARAQSVAAALVAAGIEPSRLTAVGYGDTKPAYEYPPQIRPEQARRIEFVILKKDFCKK